MKYLFFALIIFSSCNSNCSVDLKFDQDFARSIKRIEDLKLSGVSPENPSDSVEIAAEILNQLTGHEAHLRHDYTLWYLASDFNADIKIWKNWYENNKCHLIENDFVQANKKAISIYLADNDDSIKLDSNQK